MLVNKIRDRLRMQRATALINILSVRSRVQESRFNFERVEQLWSFRRCGSIRAVDCHSNPAQIRGNTASQPSNVSVTKTLLARKARNFRGFRRWRSSRLKKSEDFL